MVWAGTGGSVVLTSFRVDDLDFATIADEACDVLEASRVLCLSVLLWRRLLASADQGFAVSLCEFLREGVLALRPEPRRCEGALLARPR
jgi:hypothetical protein